MEIIKMLPRLTAGDTVEIIAPASKCTPMQLTQLKGLLTSWQLHCIVEDTIFGDDLLCANTDEVRFALFKKAVQRKETKAIICARGGYGSMRLLPRLCALAPPPAIKLFVGMSDITALHLYLLQKWNWPVLHGALTLDIFSAESIAAHKAALFTGRGPFEYIATPMNALAAEGRVINAPVIGGNLSIIQTGIGTIWQLKGSKKIVFLEDTSERGYRIDRMLEHLHQAGLFKNVAAIIFGDFIKGDEPNGTCLVAPVLQRFAEQIPVPVVQIKGIGHAATNFPLPMGVRASLTLGSKAKLRIAC